MASFNKVILMGRLTSQPELKQSTSGVSVTSFNIAVDRRYNKGEEKQTDFITIVAWRATAEFICRYFGKGQAILICGELQTRSWEDKQGNKRNATEVVASEVSFCEAKRDSETSSASAPSYASQSNFGGSQPNFEQADIDSDLPF
jgi:single-strand DNA-binding protein